MKFFASALSREVKDGGKVHVRSPESKWWFWLRFSLSLCLVLDFTQSFTTQKIQQNHLIEAWLWNIKSWKSKGVLKRSLLLLNILYWNMTFIVPFSSLCLDRGSGRVLRLDNCQLIYQVYGSVRSSRSHNLRSFVRASVRLEFVWSSQSSSPRSLMFQFSLRSLSSRVFFKSLWLSYHT